MAGYVPLFDSLTKGTLCGRWPDIGLWPIVLSMSDKNGIVDVTPQYISGVTGLDVDDVAACMARFCQPDPYSRSSEADGARLRLLDEHREWGWQVINHKAYREKARLMGKNEREVETGKNQDRKTAAGRRSPPPAAAGPPSYADADSYANSDRDNGTQSAPPAGESSPKVRTPAGEMATVLRDLGVTVTSMDETLTGWVRDGFTVHQVTEATGLARMRKPYPERIPAAYIDPILRKPQKPPTKQVDRVTWRPPPEDEVASVSK